jgi:uncharacterized Zn finger protein
LRNATVSFGAPGSLVGIGQTMTGSRYLEDQAPTVSYLVARFQLRRRAPTEAFRAGVGLARSGFVSIASIAADQVHAEVRDPSPLAVDLYVERGSLVGRCPCPAATHSVCRHQVAVAHAVWANRRHRAPGS